MNSQIMGLKVAGFVFGFMAFAQLLRLVIRPEVVVASYLMPLWPNMLALVILGGLSYWMMMLSHRIVPK